MMPIRRATGLPRLAGPLGKHPNAGADDRAGIQAGNEAYGDRNEPCSPQEPLVSGGSTRPE